MPGKAPRVDSAAWDRYKEEIISLYRESSLKDTKAKMNEIHGFQASESQYRARLKAWKIGKHVTPDVWVFIDGRIKKRRRAGKKTDIRLYGELEAPPKVAKEIARNVTLVDTLQDLSDVPTPDGVEILTPRTASPIGSYAVDVAVVLRNFLRSKRIYMNQALHYCGIVLVEAASKGRTIEVMAWMGFRGSPIHPRWLSIALRAAAEFQHFQTAEYLINSGADINASGGLTSSTFRDLQAWSLCHRMTPIQIAAEKDDIDLVKLLLHHGANPNPFPKGASADTDLVGLKPLQYAAQNRNFDMVQVLLDAGSHPDSGADAAEGDTVL